MDERLPAAAIRLATAVGLWAAWAKKVSGTATELSSKTVRNAGLQRGLVDDKVCAIDDVFSVLRFVVLLEKRTASAACDRV